MNLILPPYPDIEIIRNEFYLKLKLKFESLLNEYILNLIDNLIILNQQNQIKYLFDALVIELNLLKHQHQQEEKTFIEPLLININLNDFQECNNKIDTHLIRYLVKLIQVDINHKLSSSINNSNLVDYCIDLYKQFINRLLETSSKR